MKCLLFWLCFHPCLTTRFWNYSDVGCFAYVALHNDLYVHNHMNKIMLSSSLTTLQRTPEIEQLRYVAGIFM